ncbi:MAG TPA: DUF2877 domain-containing protein, partial [Solirubrobacteraceae bacterium]|nr:DUF2877 domain-containing protein [Solirubrobacteraceae bacterium]
APLGRAYLRCAERGELPAPAAAVLSAIRRGDRAGAARRAARLADWGASSGAALLWGIAAGAGSTGRALQAQDPGAGKAGVLTRDKRRGDARHPARCRMSY